MATLSVELTAKIAQLEKALKQARADLVKTGETAESAGKKVENIGRTGGRGMTTLKKATGNATPTLLEFNRVIQDAPFGIQGVANNITQLTQNFGTLSTSLGGPLAALRAVGAAFAGPAGLLFVVSAATSLLVSFGGRAKKTKDLVKDLREEIDKSATAFDRYRKLEELGIENAQLTGKATTVQRKNLVALIEGQQILNRAKLLENQQQLATLEAIRLQRTAVGGLGVLWDKGVANVVSTIKRDVNFVLKGLAAALAANKGLTDLSAFLVSQDKQSKDLTKEESDLIALITDQKIKILELDNEILKINKEINEELVNRGANQRQSGTTTAGLVVPAIDISGLTAPTLPNLKIFTDAETQFAQFLVRLKEFEQVSSQIITGGIIDTFTALGDGIASALSGADNALQGFFNGIMGAIGNFLTQLGQAAIATGIGMLALKNAFKNPLAAIAAGTALVAAGALFSKASQSAPGGGFSGSGSVSGQGSQSFSGSASVSSAGFDGGTVVFEIAGTKLVGVLNRTLKQNRRSLADVI